MSSITFFWPPIIYVRIMANIFVAYASFGEGHKKAAYALRDSLGIPVYDLLDFSHPCIKKIYSSSYLFITCYLPFIWRIIFASAKIRFFSSFTNRINRIIFRSFIKYLKYHTPQILIVTHFFPSQLIESIKDGLKIKVISVVTDLRVHPLWVNRCIDYYFAALEMTREDLLKQGVEAEKIFTCFAPLRKGFLKDSSINQLHEEFSLPAKPGLIFVSSLLGTLPFLKETISSILKRFNIFVIYGQNNALKKYLESINSESLRFFSSYEKMWDLVSLSSIIITKPGGLTIFEGIYKRKPFIFTHYIPGQEKENMEALIELGVARFARKKEEFLEALSFFEKSFSALEKSYPLTVRDISVPLGELIQKLSNG